MSRKRESRAGLTHAAFAALKAERDAAVKFMHEVIDQRRMDVAERLSGLTDEDSILLRTDLIPREATKKRVIIGRTKINKK